MTSAVLLMDKMKVDAEEKRKREHAERTNTLLAKSSLPKRMQVHADSNTNKKTLSEENHLIK